MSEEHRFHANEDGGLIFDNDFEHDAMFRVHGDFGTDEERFAYTTTIVSLLNHRAQPEPAAPTVVEPVVLPCCGYTASAIKWNPYNQAVQCHNCGQTYTHPPRTALTDAEIDAAYQKYCTAGQIGFADAVRELIGGPRNE